MYTLQQLQLSTDVQTGKKKKFDTLKVCELNHDKDFTTHNEGSTDFAWTTVFGTRINPI